MARVVENLARANTEIINTVQTISSITEEVNAHASQTYSISEENQRIVSHINELVGDLNSDATALMSHR